MWDLSLGRCPRLIWCAPTALLFLLDDNARRLGPFQKGRRPGPYQPGATPTPLYTSGRRFISRGPAFGLDKWSGPKRVPEGRGENSTALQCRGSFIGALTSPVGTADISSWIQSSLIVGLHSFFECRPFSSSVEIRACKMFTIVRSLAKRLCQLMLALQRSEHASSHYEFVVPANRWLPVDFRVGRCALVRQRILRSRPYRGLYYKGCAGPKPACSP